MEILHQFSVILTLASVLGAGAGTFYGFRQKAVIKLYQTSNSAYIERNEQLEEENVRIKKEYSEAIAELKGRVHTLESLKTPDISGLKTVLNNNHNELLFAIKSIGK